MSRNKIELKGIRAVEDYFFYSKRVETFANSNDKEPSWDGNIYLYNTEVELTENHKKSDKPRKIPVQVKSHIVESFKGKEIGEWIVKSDIENYLEDGGIVIFVSHILKSGNTKLYYNCLLPFDLKVILNKNKQKNLNQKIKIKLVSIENYTAKEFDNILIDFSYQKKLQMSGINNDIPIEEISEFTITKSSFDYLPRDTVFKSDCYIYGVRKKGDIPAIVGKGRLQLLHDKKEVEISIDGKVYFNNICYHYNGNDEEITYDDCIKLITKDNNDIDLRICKNITLDKKIKALEFMLNFYKKGYFCVDNKLIEIPNVKSNNSINEIEKKIEMYNKYISLCNKLNIDTKDIILDRFTNDDYENINILTNAIIDNNNTPTKNASHRKVQFSILDKNVLMFESAINKESCKLIPYNELTNKIRFTSLIDQKHYIVSPYVLLNRNDIVQNTNIISKELYQNIIGIEYSEVYGGNVVNIILELLQIYDANNEDIYLDYAQKLNNWLLDNDNNYINKLNGYQILYRRKILTPSDYIDINNISCNYSGHDKKMIMCSCFILLDKVDDFNKCFELLDSTEKERFREYPIYNLICSTNIK